MMRFLRLTLLTLVLLPVIARVSAQDAPEVPSLVLSGHEDAVTVLAWSPDGALLVSSAGNWDSTDHTVRLWNTDGTPLAEMDDAPAPVSSLDWSPDGLRVAAGSWNVIHIYSADGVLLNTIEANRGTVSDLDWSPDGERLASASLAGTRDNTIQVWTAEGELLHTLPTQYSGGKFLNVGWSPDGQFLAGGATDYWLWSAEGTPIFTHEQSEFATPAWGFAWSPDSSMWGIGNESGVVWVYSVDGEEIANLQNGEGNVDVMAWSPDGTMLLGGNALWEWTGEAFQRRSSVGGGRLAALAWSPDSTTIAAASVNQPNITLWNIRGQRLGILTGHESKIETIAWSPNSTLLASASNDTTIRLWQTEDVVAVAAEDNS